jgi:hypothetical protein
MADGAQRGGYNDRGNRTIEEGISEIEGKVARVATSESGTRASFKRPPIESQIVESYETSPEAQARRISEQAVDKRSERRGAGKNQ